MNAHALKILEFPKFLSFLARYTDSEPTRTCIRNLLPDTDFESVKSRLQEIVDYNHLTSVHDIPSFIIPEGVQENLMNSRIHGWMLNPDKIQKISSVLTISEQLLKIINSADDIDHLKSKTRGIGYLKELMKVLSSAIDENGDVRDDASQQLATIRRKILRIQDNIRTHMLKTAIDLHKQGVCQEPLVTLRNDRYVLPVRSGSQRSVPGIMHDRSDSGATVFIEPQFAVSSNNKLAGLRSEERAEIKRILRSLTEIIGKNADTIHDHYNVLVALDLIRAKTCLSNEIGGKMVTLDRIPQIDIKDCRNPLMVLQNIFRDYDQTFRDVVPIDAKIDNSQTMLVITGPNTGGKTVALKSIGLVVLMVQTGVFPPVSENSTIGIFKNVFADIGDEQSLEQSLSTFSAHLKQIIQILESADTSSLVLLDELGAGTDPSEGSALGIAILSELLRVGAFTIATTHHNSIKAFAFTTQGIGNAAVEFDNRTLQPTYRIQMDRVGQSNALQIAARLGFPKSVLDVAHKHLDEQPADIERMLAAVEREHESAKRHRKRANVEQQRAKDLRKAREDVLNAARAQADKIVKKATQEAERLLFDLKDEYKAWRKTLRKLEKKLKTSGENELKEEIKSLEMEFEQRISHYNSRLDESRDAITESQGQWTGAPPDPGCVVWVNSLHKSALVENTLGKDAVSVKIDGKTVILPVSGISPLPKSQTKASSPDSVEIRFYDSLEGTEVIPMQINLIGYKAEEAKLALDKYIDKTYRSGYAEVQIIHGFGTGRLQEAVVKFLKTHPLVKGVRSGDQFEGGDAVTIAILRRKE